MRAAIECGRAHHVAVLAHANVSVDVDSESGCLAAKLRACTRLLTPQGGVRDHQLRRGRPSRSARRNLQTSRAVGSCARSSSEHSPSRCIPSACPPVYPRCVATALDQRDPSQACLGGTSAPRPGAAGPSSVGSPPQLWVRTRPMLAAAHWAAEATAAAAAFKQRGQNWKLFRPA